MEDGITKLKVGQFTSRKPLLIKEENVPENNTEESVTTNIDYSEEGLTDLNTYVDKIEAQDNITTAEVETKIVVPEHEEISKGSSKEPFFSSEKSELEKFILNNAGPFYANYVQHFHPEQLKKGGYGIRQQAAIEFIEFAKVLLTTLKREL